MSTPQIPSGNDGRAGWPKIAAGVGLTLVSALAIVNSVGLSRLAEQTRSSAQSAHVQALVARVGDLEQQAEAFKRQAKPSTQADIDAARQALEGRLSQLEQAQAGDDRAGDLGALQARVGDIEARLKKATPPATAAPRRAAEAAQPKVPEPPFTVVGVELRGGERFLSVTAPKAASVSDMRLLREGDAVGAWHLQTIGTHAAVFRVDGQVQRIALP
jgi:BMFP domain-containing protein YqiC